MGQRKYKNGIANVQFFTFSVFPENRAGLWSLSNIVYSAISVRGVCQMTFKCRLWFGPNYRNCFAGQVFLYQKL